MNKDLKENESPDIKKRIEELETLLDRQIKLSTNYADLIVSLKMENVINRWIISKILAYNLITDEAFKAYFNEMLKQLDLEMEKWGKDNKLGDIAKQSLNKQIEAIKKECESFSSIINEDNLVKRASEDAKRKYNEAVKEGKIK